MPPKGGKIPMEWAIFDFFFVRMGVFRSNKVLFLGWHWQCGGVCEEFFFVGASVLTAQYSSTGMQVLQY